MDAVAQQFFNLDIMGQALPLVLRGLVMTLTVCAVVIPLGLTGGLLVALAMRTRSRAVRALVAGLIDFFRAVPPLVLLMFIHAGLPFAGLRPSSFTSVCIAFLLNKWSLQRDADPEAGTDRSFEYWRIKFENLSGPGIFIYVVLLTLGAIVWIKSLDVTWYSSIWGLQFLVGQGYAVLALSILSVILLSRMEPMKTLLRATEQHDLGKLAFAFVMLNIYLTFAEFLIIWSGNVPDEIPWYLARIHGGWWVVCSADWVFHWLVPFSLLLSRDLKRSKSKMIWLCCWMIFARIIDMFWIVEPNFRYAAGDLVHEPFSVLAYFTVPIAVIGIWAAFYITQLMSRPLVNVNDPHLEEILEPEHAH